MVLDTSVKTKCVLPENNLPFFSFIFFFFFYEVLTNGICHVACVAAHPCPASTTITCFLVH